MIRLHNPPKGAAALQHLCVTPAGEYHKLRDIILKHIPACKIAGLAALGLQLLSLMVSCSLYYAEGRPPSQARLDHRSLDNRHPYHPVDYETASNVSVRTVRISPAWSPKQECLCTL